MITATVSQEQKGSADFYLDIQVEPIQEQKATGGANTYTTACNCATTSCIDDDRNPSRCPDD
ncbi:MAG: hypothetical protein H0U76_21475 [Ktedonobacteraceae bacterium]|nr:hypothetical protein [Ktedonobacteraceae bacterium]